MVCEQYDAFYEWIGSTLRILCKIKEPTSSPKIMPHPSIGCVVSYHNPSKVPPSPALQRPYLQNTFS